MTEEVLRGYSRRTTDFLNTSIQRTGCVLNAILGLNGQGAPVLVVVQHDAEGEPLGLETMVVPGPFRDFQDEIREAFAQRSVQAALFCGEAWTFPPEDPEVVKRHVLEGLMPSQHPNRQEIVFLSMHWPRGGIGSLSAWRIVRPPTGAYLRPLVEEKGTDPQNILTFFSSWVDEVLPQPLPGE